MDRDVVTKQKERSAIEGNSFEVSAASAWLAARNQHAIQLAYFLGMLSEEIINQSFHKN